MVLFLFPFPFLLKFGKSIHRFVLSDEKFMDAALKTRTLSTYNGAIRY